MKTLISIILALLLSTANIMAQVGDVKKNVDKDKDNAGKTKSAEMTSSSTNNNDGWFIGSVVGFFTTQLVQPKERTTKR